MIDIAKLVFRYPRSNFSLSISDLQLAEGERVAVTGASGSGKSTLLNLIAGVLLPDSGEVRVDGRSVSGLSDPGRRLFRITKIGFIFQGFELIDYLNIFDNIIHPYRICDRLSLNSKVKKYAHRLAENMGIAEKLNHYPDQLSQGEKQRAAICRALINHPTLLLADEATGNLDPDNKQRIMDLLFEYADDSNATLLAVTHDHALLSHFDRVIDAGELGASA